MPFVLQIMTTAWTTARARRQRRGSRAELRHTCSELLLRSAPPGSDVGGEPVQTLVETLSRGGTGALDVPVRGSISEVSL